MLVPEDSRGGAFLLCLIPNSMSEWVEFGQGFHNQPKEVIFRYGLHGIGEFRVFRLSDPPSDASSDGVFFRVEQCHEYHVLVKRRVLGTAGRFGPWKGKQLGESTFLRDSPKAPEIVLTRKLGFGVPDLVVQVSLFLSPLCEL